MAKGRGDLYRVVLLVSAALSVGIHAALAPEHLHEWAPLGASFVAAAAVVSGVLVVHTLRPGDRRPVLALALVLGGLIAAYTATRLAALPPLDPDRESPDALGLGTCAVEALGVSAALRIAGTHPFATSLHRTTAPLRGGKA
jgi:hypothetical protein